MIAVVLTVIFNCLQIILGDKSLSTELIIKNTDNKPFSFTTALHTYFHVSTLTHFSVLTGGLSVSFNCMLIGTRILLVITTHPRSTENHVHTA